MARHRLLFAALLTAVPCFAQFPAESERLMATARLWVTVEYFHPYLAYREIDWDNALVKALPTIRAATNVAEYRTGISGMLDELHDPATLVIPEGTAEPVSISVAASAQFSRVQTASQSSWLITEHGTTPEKILVDLQAFQAVVRLSESMSQPPALRTRPAPPEEAYPSTELRLLAAIKTWGVIHYFFAYKDLVDDDWDEVFVSYLPKFIEAHDATEYNLVFADLLTHLTDTNTAPHSKTLDAYFGETPVGLRIRLLEKYPIVTEVQDPAATAAGVRPGDVVKRIGKESITDRFRRYVQYVPASTVQRSGYDTVQKVTNGPAGTELELAIENAQGEAHIVKLTRQNIAPVPEEATRVLPGNIGYVKLDGLTPEAAADALIKLKDTKAIILDLRGPNAPAASIIASHLALQANAAAALITTPVALHPDVPTTGIATQTTNTFSVRTVPAPQAPLYKGKTIALIDERTIGEAEYAGLVFEAANKTEFVGEPSAGADSSIAELAVPGSITISFSTQDIRHGNGGKLQRLGIQPNILAPTTAKGLRAGKDEALDAAIAQLSH